MVYAVEENLCLVMLVNPQFEYGVSNYSTSQVRYTGKKISIISLIKSFFFLFKFSNWLSSGWVSVHLKLGADINQQKPRSVCVANAVITLLDMTGALEHQVWCGVMQAQLWWMSLELPCSAPGLSLFFSSADPAVLPGPCSVLLWAFSLDLVLNVDSNFKIFSCSLHYH